jgi:hypothetical protein
LDYYGCTIGICWTEGNFAEAAFPDAGTVKTAYYDFDNNLVGTTTLVDFATLRKKQNNLLLKNIRIIV